MREISKINKNLTEYQFADTTARANIDTIADELNNLEIPNKTSDLVNDSGFITEDESDKKYATISEVEELKLFKFPNATIFGTPTIQNGQVSNFSNDNYLQFPFLVDFQNRIFIIKFSFTTPNSMSGQENILDSNFGLAFAIREGRVVAVASDNGTSWTTGELISDETLSPNSTYYFNIYWINGKFGYAGGLSKDNTPIIKETTMANTPYPKTIVIGRSYVNGGNYYKGSINLNDASLEISQKVVWTGMDDVGLATRAAIDLSNIDSKGEEVIDNRIDNKISTKQDILVSGTNIKTINNQSILGSGNITIQGGTSGDYLPLSGGVLTGHIQLGDGNTTAFKKVETVRNVNNIPNGAAFYMNSDGTASFFHKTYATTGLTSAVNDAILKFNNEGLYFAKGETNRTSATDFKEVLTEGNVKTIGGQSILGSGDIPIQGGGKTYTGASGVTVDNENNIIGVDALSSVSISNIATNEYYGLTYKRTTSNAVGTAVNFRKLKVNGEIVVPNGTTAINLDEVYINKNNEWVGSQEQYDAIETKDPNTTYYII